MTEFIYNGPKDAWATLLLTHGASEQVDSAFLTTIAEGLAEIAYIHTCFD